MHWKNSDFQIRNFIANGCHTADEAYRQLAQLYEERCMAIDACKVSTMRTEAKALKATTIVSSSKLPADVLEAKADLAEIDLHEEQAAELLAQAVHERDYIKSLMDDVQPLRKYGHLPDCEAFQLIQEEEWEMELRERAENYIATQGYVPHDQLSTMRKHPAWADKLYPHIVSLVDSRNNGKQILLNSQPLLGVEIDDA